MRYQPRNDNVLVRVVSKGRTKAGLHVADQSVQGKQYFVEAIGPKVEGLKVGDRVLMVGQYKIDYDYLPDSNELLLIKEGNVALIYEDEAESPAQP